MTSIDTKEIWDNLRASGGYFLPGVRPTKQQCLRAVTSGAAVYDGLNPLERALILSTLPARCDAIHLHALDKGFSGAKVMAARYPVGAGFSRPFVFKIGAAEKIAREVEAMSTLVAPRLNHYGTPITRAAGDLALVVQDLHADNLHELRSLREVLPESASGGRLIRRLFTRLAPFYATPASPVRVAVGDLFKWHLSKRRGQPMMPAGWSRLPEWVADLTGAPPTGPVGIRMNRLLRQPVTTPLTISHGDLHAQNVLIDSAECWPIDFAWTSSNSSPLVDLAMLECSLKFYAMPALAPWQVLIDIEQSLVEWGAGALNVLENIPYRTEIKNVLRAVLALREIAIEDMQFEVEDYRRALLALTYALTPHKGLHRPLVLASMQLLLAHEQFRE